ncbi:MAG: ribonuclease III [Eubacteriales bacterium]|nr:ribonuclease III [Eubacteriales bacterium]
MPQPNNALDALEKTLAYTFQNRSLLETALTHTSFVKGDGKRQTHNERLEFLGDAVLELCVSEHLYRGHPELQEGAMTRHRARLVCEQALFSAAVALGIPEGLQLGNGEELTGGRSKPSIVSDALEAVIGAIYLDGGLEHARRVILERVIRLLEDARVDEMDRDYKTRLQEYVQKGHIGSLEYGCLDETGPEHQKRFTICVRLSGEVIGEGTGLNKQSAGQAAAKDALIRLGVLEGDACD